jgi:hypothetical protein
MDHLENLANQALSQNPNLWAAYQGGDAVAYYVVGLMLRTDPLINEDAAFVAAKMVLERAHLGG